MSATILRVIAHACVQTIDNTHAHVNCEADADNRVLTNRTHAIRLGLAYQDVQHGHV